MSEGKVYIGTSGWNYRLWQKIFYPEDLSSRDYLKFYSQNFKTVEVNSSFYQFPRNSTYRSWYSQVPDDFVFF